MSAETNILDFSSETVSSDVKKNSQNISVIIPILNECDILAELDQHISLFYFGEVIYVDGGSTDGSWEWLQENVDFAIQSDAGRAKQMNAGAKKARNDYLFFLHADTRLPERAASEILKGCSQASWGRFDVQILSNDWLMKTVSASINLRSRITGVSTGDQGLFIERPAFWGGNGFNEIPIMEDVEITKRLKNISKPYCSKSQVKTSPRRWIQHGKVKTILLMWLLRWKYYRGESPEALQQYYRDVR